LKTLLELQALDLEIEAHKAREEEIPKQKDKIAVYRSRLSAELEERHKTCQDLALEQRELEHEIEHLQSQAAKYNQQLFSVKKNEEYQALLHEIDMLKKQVALKEERIIAIMMEADEAKVRLEEDKKRIAAELKELDRQAQEIDQELAETVAVRKGLEDKRGPAAEAVKPELLKKYVRIRGRKKTGPAVVALNGESCSGCHMHVRPQIVNELLAGEKVHSCSNCGRLLYHEPNVQDDLN